MAHYLYSESEILLEEELKKLIDYRLIGIGISNFVKENNENYKLKLEDVKNQKKNKLENALDEINQKLGFNNITVGRHFNNN